MGNNLIRPQQWSPPAEGTRDGNWMWDGTRWVCAPDCFPPGPPQPCPPGPPPFYPPPQGQPPWYPGANGGVSFGTTPPPNPIRGAFWWDGLSLWLFDGAAWTAIGGQAAMSGSATVATGSSPPSAPQPGQLWFDGNALLVWTGTMWEVVGGNTSTGSTAPSNPVPGQMWFNGAVLYVWDGNAWVPTSQTKSYIQPTAPPSPNPGDTWWDGQQMRIWDGSQWELVGPGATVGPVPTTTKVFQLTMSAASLALPAGVWAPVPFTASPQIDTSNGWDPSTHKYTPQKAGMYWFFINSLYIGGSGNPAAGASLLFNDSGSFLPESQNYVVSLWQDGVTQATLTGSGVVHMNGTTDFVRLWGFGNDGLFHQASASQPTIVGLILP